MEADAYRDMARVEADHWWFAARRTIARDLIARLCLPSEARILEVGTGTGGNLDLLAEFGRVAGFEMSREAIAIAERKTAGRHDVRQGTCPDAIPFEDERFDLVCLFDVLEHIDRDRETLAALRAHLSPGGRILLTVPANPWMFGPHDRFLHHKRRYTRAGLAGVAKAAGLEIETLTPFNTLLFPLAAAARIADRLRPNQGHTAASLGSGVPPAPVNAVLRSVFAAERHLIGRVPLPFGVSLIGVLRP